MTNRVELATSLHRRASLRKIARAKGSPLEWTQQHYGEDPGKFVTASVVIHQDRTRYVLEHDDHYGKTDPKTGKPLEAQWNPLVDVSVDDVQAQKARGRKINRNKFRFGAFEADLNHPGTGCRPGVYRCGFDADPVSSARCRPPNDLTSSCPRRAAPHPAGPRRRS